MKYMGSKSRIAKYILPIMLNRHCVNTFYDVFTGGANLIDKVPPHYNRIAIDNNIYLIEALKLIQTIQAHPESLLLNMTETGYKHVRDNKQLYKPAYVGYVGHALSYGGKWFGGWCRDSAGKRNYVQEAYKNAVKQSKLLNGIKFICCSYDVLKYKKNSIIYCDPPYNNTTKYDSQCQCQFNHNKFWNWCRRLSKSGYNVYISEYSAPHDFKCIWQKEITSSLTKDTGSRKGVEKLFVYKNI